MPKQLFSKWMLKYNQHKLSDVWSDFGESTVCYSKVINFVS